MSRFDYLADLAAIGIAHHLKEPMITPDKLALLFYIAGSLCFLVGSVVLWFK